MEQISKPPVKGTNRMAHFESFSISPVLKSFVAGSISGTCSTLLFQPLDLVKTRLQSSLLVGCGSPSVGMVSIMEQVIKTNHFLGLWKGITPSIVRSVPGVGLYFSSLHWLKSTFRCNNPKPLEALVLGATARSFSVMVLIPFTVVKVRYESDVYGYKSVFSAVRVIYTNEGTKGLTCGLVPTILRDAPFSGLYLLVYTQAKKCLPADVLQGNMCPTAHFTCGVMAGLMSSFITQPFDVVKTKMQLYPQKFSGVTQASFFIYREYGLPGYFKGLAPRMLRRTLMAALAWTVYEQMTRKLNLK